MSRSGTPVSVVVAADDAYAMPLAATVKSVLLSLRPGQPLHLYVMDGGLSAESRTRLLSSWEDPRLTVRWLQPDLTLLDGFPVQLHVNRTTYVRLLAPAVLPQTLERVIYLDSDLLVRSDLTELWEAPWEGADCLAVPDIAAPWTDSEVVLENFGRCGSYLAAARPIPNYRELGWPAHNPYFNAGVLVINLPRWRATDVGGQALHCLETYRDHVMFWDQYALNVVLYGRWRPLDWSWNQGTHFFSYPRWQDSPVDAVTFGRVRREPRLVHFTTHQKPWHLDNRHPFRGQFFRVVDQTAWAGWRPGLPHQRLLALLRDWSKRNRRAFKKWLKAWWTRTHRHLSGNRPS